MFDDYFAAKREQLGMDRLDTLGQIQRIFDEWYPGRVRARQLHQGVLRVVTPSAGVAGELRMRQLELLARIEKFTERPARIAISIGQLRG